MPVLSLPLALISDLFPRTFVLPPIRIPFPVIRIGSILPCSLSEPLKDSLLALFKLAWSNKVQLPVLITVCFLALDVRLQLEINIFWEPPRNGNRQRGGGGGNRIVNGPRNADSHAAAVHGAALVAATLVHRERERIRLNEERDRQLGLRRHAEDRLASIDHHDEDNEDTDTDTDTDSLEWFESPEAAAAALYRRKRLKKKQSAKKLKTENGVKKAQSVSPTKSNNETGGGDSESEDEDSDEDEDDDSDSDELSSDDTDTDTDTDDDDDDDDYRGRGGHGEGSHPRGSRGYDDDRDDFFGHNRGSGGDSDTDDSSGGTPLVVELEIRQRTQATTVCNLNLIQNNLCSSSLLKTGICGSQLFKYHILPATHKTNFLTRRTISPHTHYAKQNHTTSSDYKICDQ